MHRRAVLSVTGAALTGLPGCLGGTSSTGPPSNDDGLPRDESPADGYPPVFDNPPDPRVIDPASFETTRVDPQLYDSIGSIVEVPLAPIDVVYYWYARQEARFVDARGQHSYERSHIYGAVLSPAPDGREDDPVAEWPQTDRIVCYCGCPHHLSSIRAATMLDNGYEAVYVIDEGFWEWHDRNYPMAGTEITDQPDLRVVEGIADPAYAGAAAWAHHPPTGQREGTMITADGTYRLELRFADVTDTSMVVVKTPAYRIAAPLRSLTREPVTG